MAGEAVLSGFIQSVFEKALTAAGREFSLLCGVRKELDKLSSTFRTVRSVLEDAEERQMKDAAVRDWLRRLKNVAYDAADVLDQYETEALRWELEGSKDMVSGLCRFLPCCCCSSSAFFRCKIAHRIKSIREELDEVVRERGSLGLNEFGGTSRLEIMERPPTSSLVDDSLVFGREEDKENIVRSLLSEDHHANVTVLSIVGMGGLGKTTMAQLVYNDKRIDSNFQLRTWVCVSESLDVSKVTKEIFESAAQANHGGDSSRNTATLTNLNQVQVNLMESLRGKRFLLVLDDLWNENLDMWQTLLSPLRCGARGSKVLVTTRSLRVANTVGSSQIHRLKGLSGEDCWLLFKRFSFVGGNSDGYPELEEIGKEIVKKLKGFPLAAKTLGSLLYSKLDENDWHNVLRSEIWELPLDRNNILPALRLSYQHLPPHLKQCFAYCSVFHKDYVFEKEDLVKIWMALGFIQPQGRKRLEDIGNEYFDDLLCRSFFQHYGSNYVMHDMFHDLAQFISVDECFRIEDDAKCYFPGKVHHVSVSSGNSIPTKFEAFYRFESLHSLQLLRGYKSSISEVPHALFLKLRCLRVLVLHRRSIVELPSSIGKLKQLRYLNLSGTCVQILPPSINRLYNLQTLKLRDCVSLNELPSGMSKLINLRHLEATSMLISSIIGIGKLTCLQELQEFIVFRKGGNKIGELKDMSELQGKLCIQNLENVCNKEEAMEAKLNEKAYINVLELLWTADRKVSSQEKNHDEGVLEGLRPHANLKELKIKFYEGLSFPTWMGNKLLSSLQNICLSNCWKCISLPPLGQLPFLRFLVLDGITRVKYVGDEFYGEGQIKGFPSLEELVVEGMPALEEWHGPREGSFFPCLRKAHIEDCPKLGVLPCLPPTLTRLRISEVGIIYLPEIFRNQERAEVEESSSVSRLPSLLSSFYISDCPNLTSLCRGVLTQQLDSLEELTIRDCEELRLLPPRGFQEFVLLKILHVYNCPKIAYWSDEWGLPSSLRNLQVRSCPNLINASLLSLFKNLTNLQQLEITDCASLTSFPEEGLPFTLELLKLSNCVNLKFLPPNLQSNSSLTTFIINNCPQIAQLSSQGLPYQLQELFINRCPLLKERYQKKGGKDWLLIAHIPKTDFDNPRYFCDV